MKRLRPLNDVIFKKLFGEKKDKHLLISFLNAILNYDVVDVDIQEEKLTKETLDSKQGILDIKAKTYAGEKINIEVQLLNQYNMIQRTLFYWSKLYTENFKTKGNYKDLSKTVTINLLGFTLFEESPYHTTYHLYEDTSKQRLTDLLEIHFIEFPKFEQIDKNLHNSLHCWLLFLKGDIADSLLKEVIQMDELIQQANDKLMFLASDDETRRLYELREKHLSDEITRIEGAKEEAASIKAKEIAVKLLKMGHSVDSICELTGLSKEEIEEIKHKSN